MAYGRLDIYWPEGPIESYPIDKTSIAIGRSSGNDVVLDTNAASRYHISLSIKDGQTVIEDLESANGTYIDGDRLTPHQPYVLHGGEEIQIGDVRLTFQPNPNAQDATDENDFKTRPIPREPGQPQRVEIVQPTFKVELDTLEQTVTPGAHVQFAITITNTGAEVDRYNIEPGDIPKGWIRLERSEAELQPGQHTSVLISFRPQRRSESTPGEYPVTLRVKSKADPTQVAEAPIKLHVRNFNGFGIAFGMSRIDSRTPFVLHAHNQGNAPIALALSGATPDNDLIFDIQPATLTLGAGERAVIQGHVRPLRNLLIGRPREHRFDILARSQDAAQYVAPVQGVLVEKPVLPMWIFTIVLPLILVVALFGLGGFGLWFFNRPHIPVISTFTASSTAVLEGESVTLSWAVSDANTLQLQIDGGTPIDVDPKLTTLPQVVTGSGQRIFTLVARNGDELAKRDVAVKVSQIMKIDAFTVSPNPVLRYVHQNVTINWSATGAARVDFQGLEALTGSPDTMPHPATGQLDLTGTPRDTLQLTLIATGADGKQVIQPVQVQIANPECVVSADSVDLRRGPGLSYPVAETVAKNTRLFPDGRDQNGQWIHLAPAPDPQVWVSISGVTCSQFSPADLTLIGVVPPAPTLTPTPALPSTQLPTQPPITPTLTELRLFTLRRF